MRSGEILRKNNYSFFFMKTLVIYHSHEGNTKWAAEYIAASLGADIAEIAPKEATVPKKGFMRFVWGGKQAVMKESPAILPVSLDWKEYDRILIGTPVWAFTFTPPIRTFAGESQISGKILGFFCTHGGGPKNTLKDLEAAFPGNTYLPGLDMLSPLQFGKEEAEKKIEEWTKTLG